MDNKKFYKKLKDYKIKLENQYLKELCDEKFTLNDYGKFSLMSVTDETRNTIKQLFISKFSEYQIGDRFQKIQTHFYKNREEVSKSIVWKIYDISIFQKSGVSGIYEFTYYCVDANDNYFPKTRSFTNLNAVDIDNGKFRTKYHYDKK